MNIQINSNISPVISVVGDERVKIVVVDDFLKDLQPIRDAAYKLNNFQPDRKTAYPGIRTELPWEYIDAVLSVVKPLIYNTYDVPGLCNAQIVMSYYSLLATRAAELEVIQRIPHFDNNRKHYYAVLHYLNDGAFGGTGFFRHRPTRFECISQERKDIYIQSVNTFLTSKGLPEQQFINKSTNHFELFAEVAYKPNRLVIYPGCILHSGLVSDVDVSGDPSTGRLTANIFIDCN